MNIDYPLHIDRHGRTATTNELDHCLDLWIQTLQTRQGERVNRPSFGTPLASFTFEPNSTAAASGIEAAIQTAAIQWLADRVELQELRVEAVEETMCVTLTYRCRTTGKQATRDFTLDAPQP